MLDSSFLPLLVAMASASYLCRVAGFWVMRFIPITPRVNAGLRATPLAVMAGISALAVANGGIGEAAAVATAIAVMWLTKKDLVAALSGVAVVALARLLAV